MNENARLADMGLEELWQLFPIVLTEHRTCWKGWYAEEEGLIRRIVPQAERISHIGSTAVDGIFSKPIIDILVEMPRDCDLDAAAGELEQNGYIRMGETGKRVSLNKGYTLDGFAERVFHLHLGFIGDNDELYFRDYLQTHPDAAREYEALKLSLSKDYEHDRDGYTEAKGAFVRKSTGIAKKEYAGRYDMPHPPSAL